MKWSRYFYLSAGPLPIVWGCRLRPRIFNVGGERKKKFRLLPKCRRQQAGVACLDSMWRLSASKEFLTSAAFCLLSPLVQLETHAVRGNFNCYVSGKRFQIGCDSRWLSSGCIKRLVQSQSMWLHACHTLVYAHVRALHVSM